MAPWHELVFTCRLKEDIPQIVIDTLEYMIAPSAKTKFKPQKHQFFEDEVWRVFFIQETAYFVGDSYGVLKQSVEWPFFELTVRARARKGYDTIRNFLDWLVPNIEETDNLLGYTTCDETSHAKVHLIYIEDEDIYYHTVQLWNKPPDIDKTKVTNNQGGKNR
jgi:hypothetical protein